MGEFDEAARERIRRGLLDYMQKHRIGAPRLRGRIMDSDPRARELALSTLQRFLGDAHRTFDMYVDMCARFLEKEGAAGVPEFGEALVAFMAPARGAEPAAAPEGEFATDAVGRILLAGDKDFHARTIFKAHASGRFAHVTETVYEHAGGPANAPLKWAYDGAAIRSGPNLFVYLRNSLTRSPKHYSLRIIDDPAGGAALGGEMFECPAWRGGPAHGRVSLTPIAKEPAP